MNEALCGSFLKLLSGKNAKFLFLACFREKDIRCRFISRIGNHGQHFFFADWY